MMRNDIDSEEFKNSVIRVSSASFEKGIHVTPRSHPVDYFRSCIVALDHRVDTIDIVLKVSTRQCGFRPSASKRRLKAFK